MRSLSLFTLTILGAQLAAAQRMVGYYGIFATGNNCTGIPYFVPELVPANQYTHLNFAFANITNNYEIGVVNAATDPGLYTRMNALKKVNTELKTAVTVGGWAMDMSYYSTMVASSQNRASFIASAIKFVRQYGFDGLDFDWEYPSDTTRGGQASDPQNLVQFMKELRQAVQAETLTNGTSRLTLSIALPGGPFHGQYFLIDQLVQYVDWFNLMAYNLHGSWEPIVECAAPLYDPASNTIYNNYSVNNAFLSMIPSSVNPNKFNLGISYSGDTYTLNTTETTPGSSSSGAGTVGWCTKDAGSMAYFEIVGLLSGGTATAATDSVGQCEYLVYNTNQWVGYDNPTTFDLKINYLKSKGMGGISVWAMDADTTAFDLTNSITANLYNKQGWLNNAVPTNGTTFSAGSKIADSSMLARVIMGVAVAIVAGFAL